MIEQRTAPYAALVLRLALSFFFFAHLYRKFGVTGYENWFNGWIKAGYPAWSLYYALVAEFAGATLLLVGTYSRYAAIFALPLMIAVSQHWFSHKGFWFADGGLEFPLCWSVMLVVQALLGDGAYSLKVPTPVWERAAQRV
jgi:putative oxidoreductase